MSTFTRRPDMPPQFIAIVCDSCCGAHRFHYRDEQGQRRWKADHAAACSGRKGGSS